MSHKHRHEESSEHEESSSNEIGHNNQLTVLSSGAISANPNTQEIVVEILNVDPTQSRRVIVQTLDWRTCPPEELPKAAFLCGVPVTSGDGAPIVLQPSPSPTPFPILTPLFITIPPQSRLEVRSPYPPHPILPPNPCYEVRIFLFNPVNVLVNSWGVDALNVPQEGNTVLNHQFWPPQPTRLVPPRPL